MRTVFLVIAVLLPESAADTGAASTPQSPGRRLMERPVARGAPLNRARRLESAAAAAAQQRRREAADRAAEELIERQSPEIALQAGANRTTHLLRKRTALLSEVARIDAELARERDSRRAALMRKYEQDLQALDEEEGRFARPPAVTSGMGGGDSLRDQIAAAVVAQRSGRSGANGGVAHQDVAHQDVDIDVVLTHIDADGDGVITKAEAKSASAGAAMVQLGPSALVGCLAGILCYVLCRVVVARCLPRRCPRTAPIQHRVSGLLQPRAGKPSSVAHSPPPPPLGLGVKGGEAVSSQDKATRMRKRHGECGPATAC